MAATAPPSAVWLHRRRKMRKFERLKAGKEVGTFEGCRASQGMSSPGGEETGEGGRSTILKESIAALQCCGKILFPWRRFSSSPKGSGIREIIPLWSWLINFSKVRPTATYCDVGPPSLRFRLRIAPAFATLQRGKSARRVGATSGEMPNGSSGEVINIKCAPNLVLLGFTWFYRPGFRAFHCRFNRRCRWQAVNISNFLRHHHGASIGSAPCVVFLTETIFY